MKNNIAKLALTVVCAMSIFSVSSIARADDDDGCCYKRCGYHYTCKVHYKVCGCLDKCGYYRYYFCD